MRHLIIQTKGKDGSLFKVLSSEEDIFNLPNDLDNPQQYNSDYKLEDDEWFHIPNFSDEIYCLEFLKIDFVSAEHDQIEKVDNNKLKFLCSIQNNIYYFQRLTPSKLIKRKWFKLSNEPVIEDQSPIVLINEFPDAIYNKEQDTLYFKIGRLYNQVSHLK